MIEVEVTARKIGNSIGIILPKDIVESAQIKEKQKLSLYLRPKAHTARRMFGILKGENKNAWMSALKEAKDGRNDY